MLQIKRYPILLLLLTLPLFLIGQTLNLDHFKTKSPRNIGPAGMSGEVLLHERVSGVPAVNFYVTLP